MENSGILFQLISSMSKGEKRVFRQQTKIQTGNKDYVKLFNLLVKTRDYNELKVMEKLDWDKTPQQYYNLKNYLFRYLLKSLNINYAGPGAKVENNIRFIKILIHKKLFPAAEKILLRTLEQCRQEERYSKILELVELYTAIVREMENSKKLKPDLMQLRSTRNDTKILLDNAIAYESMYDQFFIYAKTKYIARGETDLEPLKSLVNNPLLNDEAMALSSRARFFFHKINHSIALFAGKYATAYKHCQIVFRLFERHPFLREDYFEEYYSNMSNLGHLQLYLGNYEECKRTLAILGQLPIPHWFDKTELLEKQKLLELRYAIDTAQLEQGAMAARSLERILKVNGSKLKPSKRLDTYYQLANFYVVAGQPKLAARWTRKIIEEPRTGVRSDLQNFARILNLFIYFDLNDPDLLEYYTRSTYRYLYSRRKLYKYEDQILKFIKKAPYSLNKNELRDLFKEEIQALETLLKDPFEKRAFFYFDTIAWLKSKLENKPMAEFIREGISKGTDPPPIP